MNKSVDDALKWAAHFERKAAECRDACEWAMASTFQHSADVWFQRALEREREEA